MKQHDIPINDDEIEPLTVAAIEEEQLDFWLSDDDDDDLLNMDLGPDDGAHHLYFGNDVALSDDDEPPNNLGMIELSKEDEEKQIAILDALMADFLIRWNAVDNKEAQEPENTLEPCEENTEAGDQGNSMFLDLEAGGQGNSVVFDLRVENTTEAGEQDNSFFKKLVELNEAGKLYTMFFNPANRPLENIQAENDQPADDDDDSNP